MAIAACFYHDTVYCYGSSIAASLVPCSFSFGKDVTLPVCLCDRGRLIGISNCNCLGGWSMSTCENNCRENRDCNQQEFSEISDYVKVLLGLVTIIFFVTFYVAIKRYIRRRSRRNGGQTNPSLVHTITGAHCYANCAHGRVLNSPPPPSYDEVNSTPPPYELVVKTTRLGQPKNNAVDPNVTYHSISMDNNMSTQVTLE